MARTARPASMLATAALCLAAAACLDLQGRADEATREPRIWYALDQESGAPLFLTGRVQTKDFLAWVRERVNAKEAVTRRLVLSARVLREELGRLERDPANRDPARKEQARKKYLTDLKSAADAADIEMVRLAIVPARDEPSLAAAAEDQRDRAVRDHVALAALAVELGCPQISVTVASTGYYDDQKAQAQAGLLALREALKAQPQLAKLEVLVSTGPGLSSNGVWLHQVLDGIPKDPAAKPIGFVLDCGTLDYSPRTALNELTARDPATRPNPNQVKPKASPKAKGRAAADGSPPPATEVATDDADPDRPPATHPAGGVKVIVLDAFDGEGGAIEIPGLRDHITRALLGQVGFEGEICLRYRGRQPTGIRDGLVTARTALGPESADASPALPKEQPARPAGTPETPKDQPARPAGATETREERPTQPAPDTGTPKEPPARPGGATEGARARPARPGGTTEAPRIRPARPAADPGTPKGS